MVRRVLYRLDSRLCSRFCNFQWLNQVIAVYGFGAFRLRIRVEVVLVCDAIGRQQGKLASVLVSVSKPFHEKLGSTAHGKINRAAVHHSYPNRFWFPIISTSLPIATGELGLTISNACTVHVPYLSERYRLEACRMIDAVSLYCYSRSASNLLNADPSEVVGWRGTLDGISSLFSGRLSSPRHRCTPAASRSIAIFNKPHVPTVDQLRLPRRRYLYLCVPYCPTKPAGGLTARKKIARGRMWR